MSTCSGEVNLLKMSIFNILYLYSHIEIEAQDDCTVKPAHKKKHIKQDQIRRCNFIDNVTSFKIFNQGGVCA